MASHKRWIACAGMALAWGMAAAAHAAEGGRPAKPKDAAFRLEDLRAELGLIDDAAGVDGTGLLHAAASLKGRTAGGLEYALGARADLHAQAGSPDFAAADLDYTENHLRWRDGALRVTLGTQNLLWGRVDEIPPADRLSRLDLSRFVLDELPDRRRAVPALRLERFADDTKLDFAWVPVFTPAVLPETDSIWHPVDRRAGRILGVAGLPPALIRNAVITEDGHGGGGAGLRLTRSGGGIDWGVSLSRARQSAPYYRFDGGNAFTAVHPYAWVLGGELETQRDGTTWRMEAAAASAVPVTTAATNQYRTEPGLDLVLSMETFPGDGDTRLTLQLAHHRTFTGAAVLDRDRYLGINGELEHPFANGRWRADVRFFAGLDQRDLYLNPRLTYLGLDGHELYLALHLFSGAEQTLGGFHADHDLIVFGWRMRM